ncbi:MAG: hypothetical protein KDH96_03740 [Candidatus Riesia sp.]|nr:hypothetical protein [Candidatus Riesia sp.]
MLKISTKLPQLNSQEYRNIYEIRTECLWENTIQTKHSLFVNTVSVAGELLSTLINNQYSEDKLPPTEFYKLIVPNGSECYWYQVIYYDNNGNAYNVILESEL